MAIGGTKPKGSTISGIELQLQAIIAPHVQNIETNHFDPFMQKNMPRKGAINMVSAIPNITESTKISPIDSRPDPNAAANNENACKISFNNMTHIQMKMTTGRWKNDQR